MNNPNENHGFATACRDGLARTFYAYSSAAMPEKYQYPAARHAECAFFPLRGIISGIIAIFPLGLLFASQRLDQFYGVMLMSFLYWAIMAKLYDWKRPAAFCKCMDRLSGHSQEQSVTAAGIAALVLLYAGKTITLYLFCAKYYIMGENHLTILAALMAVPVLAEIGSSLLYCSDTPGQAEHRPLAPLLPAFIIAAACGWILLRQLNPLALIIPFALAVLVLFYWKRKADKKFGGPSPEVLDAYRESAELAIVIGMVMAP